MGSVLRCLYQGNGKLYCYKEPLKVGRRLILLYEFWKSVNLLVPQVPNLNMIMITGIWAKRSFDSVYISLVTTLKS